MAPEQHATAVLCFMCSTTSVHTQTDKLQDACVDASIETNDGYEDFGEKMLLTEVATLQVSTPAVCTTRGGY